MVITIVIPSPIYFNNINSISLYKEKELQLIAILYFIIFDLLESIGLDINKIYLSINNLYLNKTDVMSISLSNINDLNSLVFKIKYKIINSILTILYKDILIHKNKGISIYATIIDNDNCFLTIRSLKLK